MNAFPEAGRPREATDAVSPAARERLLVLFMSELFS